MKAYKALRILGSTHENIRLLAALKRKSIIDTVEKLVKNELEKEQAANKK